MKGRLILLDHLNGKEAAALMVDGKLHDIFVETDAAAPGTIYRAVAERPVKGQGGMFLRTPDGSAFLRQVKGLAQGAPILVQVSGYAERGKAIPVSSKVLFKSRYVIVTPDAPGINISRQIRDEDRREVLLGLIKENFEAFEGGMILRSSCVHGTNEDILEDAENMLSLAQAVMADADGSDELLVEADGPHALAWREWTEPAQIETHDGCFEDHGVLDAIDALHSAEVALTEGSYFIEPTRACVTVDVNTGADTSPAAALKANIAMARDLPRQLRLRGLGGQIVIDPAPMPKKDRRQLETVLKAALKQDTVETNFVGWTTMGLIELQRARARSHWMV